MIILGITAETLYIFYASFWISFLSKQTREAHVPICPSVSTPRKENIAIEERMKKDSLIF